MSIFSANEIAVAMRAMNPWWEGGSPPARAGLKRTAFRESRDWAAAGADSKLLLLKGPRWVGKTTLLYQLAEDLLESGVDPKKILYLSYTTSLFDFSSLDQLFRIFAESVGELEGRTFLLLDEADRGPDWVASLRGFLETDTDVRVVATVSPAALTEAALTAFDGSHTISVDPLSFSEFLRLRRLAPRKRKPPRSLARFYGLDAREWAELIMSWSDLELFLEDYLARGGFPRTIEEAELARAHRALREDVLEESLTRDAAFHSGARNPSEYKRLFTYIAYRSGEIWNAARLAEELVISGGTVLDYLDHLERSELVLAATNYREERGEAVRIRRKFFPADPSLRNALLFRGERISERLEEREKAVTTAVMAHLFRQAREDGKRVYFWRDGNHEVDFVLQDTKGAPVPLVVRCGTRVGKAETRDLLRFMEQYQARRGIVVTWGREQHGPLELQSDLFEKPDVVLVPAWLFLFMYGDEEQDPARSAAAGSRR